MTDYNIGDEATLNGEPVTLNNYSKGWWNVIDANGDSHKCRAKDLKTANERDMPSCFKDRRKDYIKSKSASGSSSAHCGDPVALGLEGAALPDVYKTVAKEIGVPESELHDKYQHLNAGQQRMCLGNRLRGHMKRQQKESEAA